MREQPFCKCVYMTAEEYTNFINVAHAEYIASKFKGAAHVVDMAITSNDFFEIAFHAVERFTDTMRAVRCNCGN